MFNDKYGLTEAVLEGRKTMTRRKVNVSTWREVTPGCIPRHGLEHSPYKIGEVVAVAQSYKAVHEEMMNGDYGDAIYDPFRWAVVYDKPGWGNKMFVLADLMPHHIRITNIRVERLQEISDEDCMKEGIFWDYGDYPYMATKMYKYNDKDEYIHPKSAFASLIDKLSGKGTWKSNPWVFVYEFKLVK